MRLIYPHGLPIELPDLHPTSVPSGGLQPYRRFTYGQLRPVGRASTVTAVQKTYGRCSAWTVPFPCGRRSTDWRALPLAFGVDADVRKAFDSHGITDFDLHAFDVNRQRYESSERGLLGEALNRAISRHRGLKLVQRRKFVPEDPSDGTWDSLRQLVGPLIGVVGGNPELRWREGITVRLDWANDQVWLLFDPCTVFEGVTDDNRAAAVDLARERSVRRYNKKTNDLIDFWARHLSQGESEMRAFNTGSGIDAVFRLSSLTGFSWRRAL